jgi:hypothetical protein
MQVSVVQFRPWAPSWFLMAPHSFRYRTIFIANSIAYENFALGGWRAQPAVQRLSLQYLLTTLSGHPVQYLTPRKPGMNVGQPMTTMTFLLPYRDVFRVGAIENRLI